MNIIVHIQQGVEQHGYELGTRQAWRCGERAREVTRIVGVVRGKIVCVIDGVHAELSTNENNPAHNPDCNGRYIFLGGKCWTEQDENALDLPRIMSKRVLGLNQGHRYMTDDELRSSLV